MSRPLAQAAEVSHPVGTGKILDADVLRAETVPVRDFGSALATPAAWAAPILELVRRPGHEREHDQAVLRDGAHHEVEGVQSRVCRHGCWPAVMPRRFLPVIRPEMCLRPLAARGTPYGLGRGGRYVVGFAPA